jgi:hypothetical protein
MDGAEFDSLTRSLISRRSRRGALGTLLGGAVSAVVAADASARKRGNNKRRNDKNKNKKKNEACCTKGGCCEGTFCRPGLLQSSCGADGQPCADCTATAQLCVVESRTCGGCDRELCAQQRNGCCAGDDGCQAGNDEEHCGSDGKDCQTCLSGERCRVAQFSDGVRRGCCAPSGRSCDPFELPCCPGEGSTCLPLDGTNGFTCCAPGDVCGGKCCGGSTRCDQATGQCVPTSCEDSGCPEGFCCKAGICWNNGFTNDACGPSCQNCDALGKCCVNGACIGLLSYTPCNPSTDICCIGQCKFIPALNGNFCPTQFD